MRRSLVQFDEEIYRTLRREAFRQERSDSSLVREFVEAGLNNPAPRKRPRRAAAFLSVRADRSKQGRLSPISERHDAALAAAFDK